MYAHVPLNSAGGKSHGLMLPKIYIQAALPTELLLLKAAAEALLTAHSLRFLSRWKKTRVNDSAGFGCSYQVCVML